jgi:hypothetical protein
MRRETLRDIAGRFDLPRSNIHRHEEDHLPKALAKAHEARKVAHADDILARLLALHAETMGIFREARAANDNDIALRAIARAERQLELQARLIGELKDAAPTVTVNVLASPEWRALEQVLIDALSGFPKAREVVARRLALMPGAVPDSGSGA